MATAQERLLEARQPDEAKSEGWRVRDRAGAVWAIAKMRQLEEQANELKRIAAEETRRIQDWLAAELKDREQTMAFFTGCLVEWHQSLMAEDPKHNKTIKLPGGQLTCRQVPPDYQKDDPVLLDFFTEADERYIELKPSLRWEDVKQAGTVVDGCLLFARGPEGIGLQTLEQAGMDPAKIQHTPDGRWLNAETGELLESLVVTKGVFVADRLPKYAVKLDAKSEGLK